MWRTTCLLSVVACFSTHAALFTSNTTISDTDTSFDGQDIIVSNAVLTVNGSHAFTSVVLTNNSVLTHSPCTSVQTFKLDLNVTGDVVISGSSRIDVTGKGYLARRTTGNTTAGAAGYGGSYGGLGHLGNRVYGHYTSPDDWGSGGIASAGGGLIRIAAGSIHNAGSILANGQNGRGSGSGGGISLQADSITGPGVIQAHGGGAGGGGFASDAGGSGGRIALTARDLSNLNTNGITAFGMAFGEASAGAGTVYLRDTDEATGRLIIANEDNNRPSGWTHLGLPSEVTLQIPDRVIIRGRRTQVRAEHSGLFLNLQGGVSVENASLLALDVGSFAYSTQPIAQNGGTLEITGDFTPVLPLILTNGGRMVVHGALNLNVPIELTSAGYLEIDGAMISTVPVTAFSSTLRVSQFISTDSLFLSGGTFISDSVATTDLTLTNGAFLTHFDSTASSMHRLDLNVTGDVVISGNSRIDASGKGYLASRTTGNTTAGAAGYGGSYGGLGHLGNRVYGHYTSPDDWGSGGIASAGGGLIRIAAGSIHNAGSILANGQNGRGSGSGGGIWLQADSITGPGVIQAHGGGLVGGGFASDAGGGGGRIALFARDLSNLNTNGVTAFGKAFGNATAGAGTVYFRDMDKAAGLLVIANGDVDGSNWTPLGGAADSSLTIADDVLIRSNSSKVRPEHTGLVLEFTEGVSIRDSAWLDGNSSDLSFDSFPALTSGGRLSVNGLFTWPIPVTIDNGGRFEVDHLVVPYLSLLNGSILSTPTQGQALLIEVSGTILIDSDSRIDVSGKGYSPGVTAGNSSVNGATGISGGSYGGMGGRGTQSGLADPGLPNPTYGDYADPEELGSGSGWPGSPGGGLIRLRAGLLDLHGSILADGLGEPWDPRDGRAKGGSGGGILLEVARITGTGIVRAQGGRAIGFQGIDGGFSHTGPGGGGRVAVYAEDFSTFPNINITAPGGTRGTVTADAGSVHLTQGKLLTHVRPLRPSGRNGGFLSNVIDSVIIEFNRPIVANTFYPALSITGRGRSFEPAFEQLSSTTFRVSFPAFTENGSYEFRMPPTVMDTEGLLLDQNANGVPGEIEDAYSYTLIVDTVAPRVSQKLPDGDVTGTLSSIDIWFSERIDKTTLIQQNLALRNPANQTITITSITEVGLNRYRLNFAGQTVAGLYRITPSTNILDLAGNPLDVANSVEVVINVVPVDLRLSDLSVNPQQLIAGDAVTVSWQGRNATGAPLLGNWSDAVYLSKDALWDISDTRLAVIPHTGGLAQNATYVGQTVFHVAGLLPGNYHVLVRADIANQAREGLGESDNLISTPPLPLSYRQLTPAEALSGTLTSAGRFAYYAISLPEGESLRVNLTGNAASGINHLFLGQGAIPTTTAFEHRANLPGQNQSLLISGFSGANTIYVLVSGELIGTENPFTISIETAPFFLTGVSPKRLVKSIGDRFWTSIDAVSSITVSGAGFNNVTTVELVDTNGTTIPLPLTEFLSPSLLKCVLPLSDLSAGIYSVRVMKGATTQMLASSLTIEPAGKPDFKASIASTALSPRGGQTVYIDYRNRGTAPMPAPLLKVTAYTNAVITTHKLRPGTIRDNGNGSVSGGGGGRGGGTIPAYNFIIGVPLNTVQIYAKGSDSSPGILHPGEGGRIPVYFDGLLADKGEPRIQFSVGSVTADDTTIIECLSAAEGVPNPIKFPRHGLRLNAPRPAYDPTYAVCGEKPFEIDWVALGAATRPETVGADAWDAVWNNVRVNVGPIWADYVMMLSDNANHLAKVRQITTDIHSLFNFEMIQASGALNPVRTLASSIDASTPTPGLPLTFRRSYNAGILSRYKLGPLGRGWTHNWDVRVVLLEKTRGVIVQGPNGADRAFYTSTPLADIVPSGSGTFISPEGEFGVLSFGNGRFTLKEPNGIFWRFAPDHRLDFVQDPNGNRVTLGYTGALLTTLSHSCGKQLTLEYGGDRIERVIDPLGPGTDDDRITMFQYEGEYLRFVFAPGDRQTEYSYDTTSTGPKLHALRSIRGDCCSEQNFDYDDRGRLEATYGPSGAQRVSYHYDSAGQVEVEDATGRKVTLMYGLNGQLAQVEDGEGRIVNFGYNQESQLSELLGPGGERYLYRYDSGGNLTGITDPLRHTVGFGYDPTFNRLDRVTDQRGKGMDYGYDAKGNLTSITYEDDSSETFGYDGFGNAITSTNRRGGVINYLYNTSGQLTNKWYIQEGQRFDFNYAYDLRGNLTNATYFDTQLGSQVPISMAYYPETDRLKHIEYPTGQFFDFEYNSTGRRTRRIDQDTNVAGYEYDFLGRLDRMTNGLGALIVDYDYDGAGRLWRKTLGNGVYTTNNFNAAGQIVDLVNRKADHSVLSHFSYTYDASGRRNSMTTLGGTESYGYDPIGQLTSVEYPDNRTVVYDYDPAGNRFQVIDDGSPTIYSSNDLNQYTTVGNETFEFDRDGNLTNQFSTLAPVISTNYAYDVENRLVGVSSPTGNWSYTYDAFGNRVAASHNAQVVRYIIDPIGLGNIAFELDGGGSLIASYENGFGLLARNDVAGTSSYYTFSAAGHTSELTDPSGEVANSYTYDPFGVSLNKIETLPNPFQFAGEHGVMHEESGAEAMRARIYLSRLGRFAAVDPLHVEGGINLYAYANNSAVSMIDPSGLQPISIQPPRSKISAGRLPIVQPPSVKKPLSEKISDFLDDLIRDKEELDEFCERYPFHALCVEQPPDKKNESKTDYSLPLPDPDETNTEDTEDSGILRSRDPNDKFGPSGYGNAGFLREEGMAYQIRFENQPSATAPAQLVTVTDTLDPNLNLSTFELTEIVFANQVVSIPPGVNRYAARLAFIVTNETLLPLGDGAMLSEDALPPDTIVVELDARLDLTTRLMTLSLTAADPLTGWQPESPLIGLLYPNDETGRGDGSISYVVRPNPNLPTGTRIENQARIVFDYNDPIDTPVVFNTIDADAPTSSVVPLPATASDSVEISWQGLDGLGSGVAFYDVFYSEGGTSFIPWLLRTTNTSATFRAPRSGTYYFYSVAQDNVGHQELAPAQPDAQITFTVTNPVNTAPVGVQDAYSVTEDTLSIADTATGVLANDTDADGDSLNATIESGPVHGVLVLNPNGSFTYEPHPNYFGPDGFTYRVSDGIAASDPVTVTIEVTPVNDPPSVQNNSYTLSEDSPLGVGAVLGVLANDADLDGNILTASIASAPAHGTLTLNSDGSFGYTPHPNYFGSDSFTYTASDGVVEALGTGALTITPVNDPPVGISDGYSTDEDETLVIVPPGVLANDTDVEGQVLSASLLTEPSHGTLAFQSDGSFSYTPETNSFGEDSFTYRVSDGVDQSGPITVVLNVTAVNDDPIAENDSFNTPEDTVLTVSASGLLTNDSDIDEDELTTILVNPPAHGVLAFEEDGSFTYTPALNFVGTDSFTYEADDGTTNSEPATVTITVGPLNDPPVALGDSFTLDEDSLLQSSSSVLANDTDPDGDLLTAIAVVSPQNGTLILTPDGTFSYSPRANFNGIDSFTYKANDGVLDSALVTVTLTVNPVNDAPSATPDSYSTQEDAVLTIAAPGILQNDSDLDGDDLVARLVTAPNHGTIVFNQEGGFNYTPAPNFFGTDEFTYRTFDGVSESELATVRITVEGVNDSPVANGDVYTTNEDTPIHIAAPGLLGNDSDVDGNALAAELMLLPEHGTLQVDPDGSFSYSPNGNFNGEDSFTYHVTDGSAHSSVATVRIVVNPINDPPIAANDSYTVAEDTVLIIPASLGLLANDADAENEPLTAVPLNAPSSGSLTLADDGSLEYQPASNFHGQVSFTYKANDGSADSQPATVTISVLSVNDVPAGTPDTYSVNQGGVLSISAPGVLGNDADPEGSALQAMLVTSPSNGAVSLNGDGSFTYAPQAGYSGADTFAYKVSDGASESAPVEVSITIRAGNQPPMVAVASAFVVVNEGRTAENSGTWSDADTGDIVVLTASVGTLSKQDGNFIWNFTPENGPAEQIVTITATDSAGNSSTASFKLQVQNIAPSVEILLPNEGIVKGVNTEVQFKARITDPGIADIHSAKWRFSTYGEEDVVVDASVLGRQIIDAFEFPDPGVYSVQLNVSDNDEGTGSAKFDGPVVIYDPNAGLLIGSGWVNSPKGAIPSTPSATGKSQFGIVSFYKRHDKAPDGHLEFRFPSRNFTFKATEFEWLVITDTRAQAKGVGTVNGSQGYRFLVTAEDGKAHRKDREHDRLRLKIWNQQGIVYDNQIGTADAAELGDGTTVSNGAIVIPRSN